MKRLILLLAFPAIACAGGDPVGTISTTLNGSTPQGVSGGANIGNSYANGQGPSATIGIQVPSYSAVQAQTQSYITQTQSYQTQIAQAQQFNATLVQQQSTQPSLQTIVQSRQVTLQSRIGSVQDQWIVRKAGDSQGKLAQMGAYPNARDLRQEVSSWTTFSPERKRTLVLSDQYYDAAEGFRTHPGNASVNPYSQAALDAGLASLTETARIAGGAPGNFQESFEDSTAMLDIAKGLLDFGLSMTPGVSVGKDAYEALSGRSLIDGSDLDFTSRSFAVLGVATAGGSNIVRGSFRGLVKLGEALHARGLVAHGFHSAITLAESGIGSIVRHSPISTGVLHAKPIENATGAMQHVSDTFRSGTYYTYKTTEPMTLYRVVPTTTADAAAHHGGFWTRIKPEGPTQSMIDSALDLSFNNSAGKWVQITVPAGETLFEGVAASIPRVGNYTSTFVGGGNQVFINKFVDAAWVDLVRKF